MPRHGKKANNKEEDDLEEVVTVEESVAIVLKKYEDVLTWLEKLPPRREIEHHIHKKKTLTHLM